MWPVPRVDGRFARRVTSGIAAAPGDTVAREAAATGADIH